MDQDNLNKAILGLKHTQDELLQLGMEMFSAGKGNMFSIDLVAIGAIKRTFSNTEGFITLIEAKNMSSARALLRVQLDTLMRFSAIWLVDSPYDFAHEIIAGKHIRDIKDKMGKKMTDRYLVEMLTKKYPWMKDVYDNLCGYIHFSDKHLFSAVENLDEAERTIDFVIGKEDTKYPEWSWLETINCFRDTVQILFLYLKSWIKMKNERTLSP